MALKTAGRNAILSFAATTVGLLAVGGGLIAWLSRTKMPRPSEHAAPDLALDQPRPGPDHRAPVAFRPDLTAVPTAEERESLRPATGSAPGFAADRGSTITEPVDAA